MYILTIDTQKQAKRLCTGLTKHNESVFPKILSIFSQQTLIELSSVIKQTNDMKCLMSKFKLIFKIPVRECSDIPRYHNTNLQNVLDLGSQTAKKPRGLYD